ncbi:DUF5133 domain-containing protein [Streptomyces uncialis]|uniref:DUF5133 domain-containing protein n=1 Tax=Streptomyces uncialis TaxID=1048205 RepID=UPI0038153DF9
MAHIPGGIFGTSAGQEASVHASGCPSGCAPGIGRTARVRRRMGDVAYTLCVSTGWLAPRCGGWSVRVEARGA